jgi:catechol 2,3-dioxygenase-like lactoylglutathione lyase family enzyme
VAIELDHVILPVGDLARSAAFYAEILGLALEPESERFALLRVTPTFGIQLAAWGTSGGQHLAFGMSQHEFEAAFARIVAAGIPYGGSFDTVGSMTEPGDETGARGIGKSLYFFDPDRHLIEIRHYDEPQRRDAPIDS